MSINYLPNMSAADKRNLDEAIAAEIYNRQIHGTESHVGCWIEQLSIRWHNQPEGEHSRIDVLVEKKHVQMAAKMMESGTSAGAESR